MKLYQSLFILTNTYDTILDLTAIMLEHNLTMLDPAEAEERKMIHYMALFKHSILEACNLLEEYENNFLQLSEEEFKERVLFVRQAAKPIMKKIYAWKDLKNIRNELIAHPWRSKKDKELSYSKIFTYNSPRTFMQLQFLKTYFTMLIGLIEAEFEKELKLIPQYMQSIQPEPTPRADHSLVLDEMERVVNEVNAICALSHKNYILLHEKIIGK
jgi:hypothetical protein